LFHIWTVFRIAALYSDPLVNRRHLRSAYFKISRSFFILLRFLCFILFSLRFLCFSLRLLHIY